MKHKRILKPKTYTEVDKTYDYTCHPIALIIRQHFGVKE